MRFLLLLGLLGLFDSCKLPSFTKDESITLEQPIDLKNPDKIPDKQSGNSGFVAPPSVPDTVPEKAAPVADIKVNTVVMHSITGCVWCESDKRRVLPNWKKNGWSIVGDDAYETPVRGQLYPWYEVFDAKGVRRLHVGSLSTWKQ